jgi:hypothetical protein
MYLLASLIRTPFDVSCDYLSICDTLMEQELGAAVVPMHVGKHLAHFLAGGGQHHDRSSEEWQSEEPDGMSELESKGNDMGRQLRSICTGAKRKKRCLVQLRARLCAFATK